MNRRVTCFLICAALFGYGTVAGPTAAVQSGVAQPTGQRDKAVRRVAKPIPDEYIVVLAADEDGEAVGRETALIHSGRLKHVFRGALNGFSIRLPRGAADQLVNDPRVILVEQDGVVQVQQAAASWNLDRIDQPTLPLDGIYNAHSSGAGVVVHVLDTGVRATHQEFGGRAFIAGDYIDDDGDGDPNDIGNDDANTATADGADCHGHGTHVAGTIGGSTLGVARNVTLYGHRVLACDGSGTTSGIIAAIDAVTLQSQRPAVVNMSLGGSASDALDAAVRRSISAGVTHVVAAGNSNVDAKTASPARVAEAITVGASDANDLRATFSNYGASLDLFAPGVGVDSAWFTTDATFARLSGTSMATPHVAGAVALYLEQKPTSSPAEVRDALVALATPNVVRSSGTGSPNLLLYIGQPSAPPAVTMQFPNGGEKIYTGMPYHIQWATDSDSLARFDVQFSPDGGLTFSAVSGCTGLAGSARSCTWTGPGPVTSKGRMRVIATNTSGEAGSDQSNANFSVSTGVATITVTAPNTATTWARGSSQQIKWTHNLGANSFVRVELSRDGGVTFPETLATGLKNTSSSGGAFTWQVSGPNVSSAKLRVSWSNGPATDSSDVGFTIADPRIAVAAPNVTSVNWGYGSTRRVKWSTNLGPLATVSVLLSTDGGATFPVTLASGIRASTLSAYISVPTLATATAAARLRVAWSNAPAGIDAAATNPVNFKLSPPFLTLTRPNGGGTWTAGTSASVLWASNLGSLESLKVELSTNGGASYDTILLPSTVVDNGQSIVVKSAWATQTAMVRIAWLKNGTIGDTSNAVFKIQ